MNARKLLAGVAVGAFLLGGTASADVVKLRRLLDLKRTYPPAPFQKAVEEALHYGLYDLARLEKMILKNTGGDFFEL